MINQEANYGRWAPADQVSSPNCDARPTNEVSLLVVHAISLPPGQFSGNAIEALFTNQLNPRDHPFFAEIAHLRVSAHFLIRRDGQCTQFVDIDQRAWHAGRSCWWDPQKTAWRAALNDFSVGVELEGDDETPFTKAQYETLANATQWLIQRYPQLSTSRMTSHAKIAPLRKTDPGPAFDWAYFHQLLDRQLT